MIRQVGNAANHAVEFDVLHLTREYRNTLSQRIVSARRSARNARHSSSVTAVFFQLAAQIPHR